MAAHDAELLVVERAWLLQDLVRDGELADVVQEATDRELPEARRRDPELLADLDREERHAPRVPLGVLVLLGQETGQRSDLRAEESLLGRDQLGAAQVSRQRARGRGAHQVERHRSGDDENAEHLEEVADPPAQRAVVLRQRGHERGGEPHDPDQHEQVGGAPRERDRPKRPEADEAVEGEPGDEQGDRGRAAGLRHVGNERGHDQREHAQRDHPSSARPGAR